MPPGGKLCCTVADIAHLLQGHQFRRSTLDSVLTELRNRKFDEKLAHASCAVRAEEMVADDLGLGDADSSLSSGSASSSNAARRRCVKAAQSQVALENPLLSVDFPVGDRVVPMLVACSVLKTKAVSFEATQRNFTALHQWCMQDVPEREDETPGKAWIQEKHKNQDLPEAVSEQDLNQELAQEA